MSHGMSTGEVFKTKIPIIFETSLGAPSKYHPTRSKFFEDDILKSIFSISNLKSIFGNDIRIYREGDIVPDLELDKTVEELAKKISDKSQVAVSLGKEAFYRQIESDLVKAYDYASDVMTRNMLSRDAEEGIDAFLEKRIPTWEGR